MALSHVRSGQLFHINGPKFQPCIKTNARHFSGPMDGRRHLFMHYIGEYVEHEIVVYIILLLSPVWVESFPYLIQFAVICLHVFVGNESSLRFIGYAKFDKIPGQEINHPAAIV